MRPDKTPNSDQLNDEKLVLLAQQAERDSRKYADANEYAEQTAREVERLTREAERNVEDVRLHLGLSNED